MPPSKPTLNNDLINSTNALDEYVLFKPAKIFILFYLKWNAFGAKLIPPTAICVIKIVKIRGIPIIRVM